MDQDLFVLSCDRQILNDRVSKVTVVASAHFVSPADLVFPVIWSIRSIKSWSVDCQLTQARHKIVWTVWEIVWIVVWSINSIKPYRFSVKRGIDKIDRWSTDDRQTIIQLSDHTKNRSRLCRSSLAVIGRSLSMQTPGDFSEDYA